MIGSIFCSGLRFFLLSTFLFAFSLILNAQSHSYATRFSYEIEKGIADGSIRSSKAGVLYSVISDYLMSVQYSDIPISWGVDTMDFSNVQFVDALDAIIEKAKDHQIIIISENHLKPQHRIFAKKIIVELSKQGFNHLGLETFSSINNSNVLLDEGLSVRGYPLNTPLTGTYSLEPKMADLIRESIDLNYHLFAYERSQKIKGKDRDEIQAENIIRYLEKNEDAKIIILCGFHHAIESDLPKRSTERWMSNVLKNRTGIDPLTIYQDNFTEKFIENESSIFNHFNEKKPSIIIDSLGSILSISPNVDLEVIHPKTKFLEGRPHWLIEDDNFKFVSISLKESNLEYPIIVSAYYAREKRDGVPADILELKYKYSKKKLVLKKGLYKVVARDKLSTYEYDLLVE